MTADEATISSLVTDQYIACVNSADAQSYSQLYAETVLWSPPGGPDQTSKSGIEVAIGGLFAKSKLVVEIVADEIVVLDKYAWATGVVDGENTNRESGDVSNFRFRVLWILQMIDADWKITRQVWNNKPV